MSILEAAAWLGMAALIVVTSLSSFTRVMDVFHTHSDLRVLTTSVPTLRALFTKTVAQASRVRVMSSVKSAREKTDYGATLIGHCLRLEYNGGVNAQFNQKWQATIEYRPEEKQLVYRNQNTNEWIIASNVSDVMFEIQQGVLRSTINCKGQVTQIYTAIN